MTPMRPTYIDSAANLDILDGSAKSADRYQSSEAGRRAAMRAAELRAFCA